MRGNLYAQLLIVRFNLLVRGFNSDHASAVLVTHQRLAFSKKLFGDITGIQNQRVDLDAGTVTWITC